MKQPAGFWSVHAGDTVVALARLFVAAEFVLRFIEVDEPADEEIEPPVIVVVKPNGARGPTRSSHSRFIRDVGKRSIAIVVIKNAVAVLRHIQISPAIAIVIADGDTHAVAAAG